MWPLPSGINLKPLQVSSPQSTHSQSVVSPSIPFFSQLSILHCPPPHQRPLLVVSTDPRSLSTRARAIDYLTTQLLPVPDHPIAISSISVTSTPTRTSPPSELLLPTPLLPLPLSEQELKLQLNPPSLSQPFTHPLGHHRLWALQ